MTENDRHFIYVLNADARKKLLQLGLRLIHDDGAQNIYIFERDPHVNLDGMDIEYVMSDTLSF